MIRYFMCSSYMLLSLSLVSCGPTTEESTERLVRPAQLVTVSSAVGVRRLKLPAVVGAAATSDLAFQVSGELQELQISEGDQVVKGQVLAALDQRDFLNDVASARAQFNNAEIEFERASRLVAENAIAQSVVDERKSTLDTTRASLDSALKSLDDSVIKAPFDGIVADIFVESFENIQAQSAVLTLQSQGDAEAIVQVPASVVANIENLNPIDIELELDAAADRPMPAVFSEAASVADPTTQTFETRFSFSPPENLVILPGMTGLLTGRFEARAADNEDGLLIRIPLAAVVAEAGQPYVWLVDEDTMTVSKRTVMVAPGPGSTVIVQNGLEGGDVIVGAGGHYLYEGAEIRRYESN